MQVRKQMFLKLRAFLGTRNGIVALVAAAILAVWVVFTFSYGDLTKPALRVEGIGNGFDGSLALPKEEINARLAAARETVNSLADNGQSFRLGSRIAAWLAFLATAAITLVAGWYGQAPPPAAQGQPAQPNTAGLPSHAARIVTVLAALAAVFTAGGGMATQEAERLTTSAREKHRIVVDARTKVVAAKTAEDATTVLDDMDLALKQ